MKLISWNVNGIRACVKKGMMDSLRPLQANVIALQETKIRDSDLEKLLQTQPFDGYEWYSVEAEKAGYSSLATFTDTTPLNVIKGMDIPEFDREARVLTLEFEDYYQINTYFPNSQRELKRLDYKMAFNNAFLEFCNGLREHKHVAVCGDLNVSHTEIDLANPKQNRKNAGFCPEERAWFSEFLEAGYIDTFREFESEGGHYSWWSYRNQARARNIGWRLDYWLINHDLRPHLTSSSILPEIHGSDHCPVAMELSL